MGRKPKDAPSGCFYSGCTGAQLQELLRACALPVSGTKPELVTRLRAHPAASAYADEARSGTLSRVTCEWVGARAGVTLDDLKEACRERGLKVTGTKYQLVLSLLCAAGPGGSRPADAAKPRAPSTKPAAPESLRSRLLAQCNADWDGWSNLRCKEHAYRVFSAALRILTKETRTKGLLEAKNLALADTVVAVLSAIADGWSGLCSPGYGDAGYELRCLFEEVQAVGEQLGQALSEGKRAELRGLCARVRELAKPYAIELPSSVAAEAAFA